MFRSSWIKVLFFWIIGIIIAIFLSFWLTPKWNYPQFNENSGYGLFPATNYTQDIDVFFLGTSHMGYGVSPMHLYENNHINTYNLATSGQPFECTAFLVKRLFSLGYKPKVLVLDVSSLFLSQSEVWKYWLINDCTSKNIFQRIDYYKTVAADGENGITILEKILEELFPLYRYHSRWDTGIDESSFEKRNTNSYFLQGYVINPLIRESWVNIDGVNYVESLYEKNNKEFKYFSNKEENSSNVEIRDGEFYSIEPLERNIQYLEKMQKLCEENNCELLLVKVPVMMEIGNYESSWTQKRYDSIKALSKQLNLNYVDLQYDELVDIDWKHDTCDGGAHLNILGAEKVSSALGKYLLEHYSIQQCNISDCDRKNVLYDDYIDIVHIESSFKFSEYLNRIIESNHELVVFLCAGDDMSTGLNDEDISALNNMGFRSNFREMGYNDSFIGVWDNGNVEYEGISNKQLSYSTNIGNSTVDIISAGYLDGNISSIVIDENEYSMNKRGINVVVYDKESKQVVDISTCDTWEFEHEVVHNVGTHFLDYLNFLLYDDI